MKKQNSANQKGNRERLELIAEQIELEYKIDSKFSMHIHKTAPIIYFHFSKIHGGKSRPLPKFKGLYQEGFTKFCAGYSMEQVNEIAQRYGLKPASKKYFSPVGEFNMAYDLAEEGK